MIPIWLAAVIALVAFYFGMFTAALLAINAQDQEGGRAHDA